MDILLGSIVGNGFSPAANSAEADAFAATLPPSQPYAVFDLFIPGLSIFPRALKQYAGIDLNIYIPLFLLVTSLAWVAKQVASQCYDWLEAVFMSVCELRSDGELFWQVLEWTAEQRFSQRSRRFVASNDLRSPFWMWADSPADDADETATVEPDSKDQPPACTPSFGSHYFWFRGRLLCFTRQLNTQRKMDKEEILISCLGRDPWILKQLVLEARLAHLKKVQCKTLIYRGNMAAGNPSWQPCMARTPRPFSTVILNKQIKEQLIADMTDYLDPSTRRWYSDRGIPYRRGYLLFGPPGTGKSSVSLALAGSFDMRIYIVSLNSAAATEENLSALFAKLPLHCIVLLEDIDTAGMTLSRRAHSIKTEEDAGDTSSLPRTGSALSLSGLLNILDGVAAKEGHIVIMTTNHIEKLDKALIRPGRIDMTVHFPLADPEIASAIFRTMFIPSDDSLGPQKLTLESVPVVANKQANEKATTLEVERAGLVAGVERLAKQFGDKMPTSEFSPAEIQGYLLAHKRDPERAVAGVDEWIVKTRKSKDRKRQEADTQAAPTRQKLRDHRRNGGRRRREAESKDQADEEGESKGQADEEGEKILDKRGSQCAFSQDSGSDSDSSSSSDKLKGTKREERVPSGQAGHEAGLTGDEPAEGAGIAGSQGHDGGRARVPASGSTIASLL